MAVHPYTQADLELGGQIVRELHGLRGFDAWAERIAKAIAAERERCTRRPESELSEDIVRKMRSEEWPERW